MFALRKDERKLQYSRSNILGFINTGYFTSDNLPDGIKNATHNTFSIFRKNMANEIKISNFFSKMTKHKQEIKNYLGTFSMVVMSLIKSVHYARFLRHALTVKYCVPVRNEQNTQ
jgi:hypothetical protein